MNPCTEIHWVETQSAIDGFLLLDQTSHGPWPISRHQVVAAVHHLCAAIESLELAGVDRQTIVDRLAPVRAIHARSPFFKRMQTWPRGYAGDFETIDYLMSQQVRVASDTLEYHLERYILDSPICQQHRNKIRAQAKEILITEKRCGSRAANILMMAAGGSHDLQLLEEFDAEVRCNVVINDADAAALDASLSKLVRTNVKPIHGDVVRSVARLQAFSPYDLVVAGGLFDYLKDRHATRLIDRTFRHLLREDGVMLFTNIRIGNPYRAWIEYLGDWRLIERQEKDLEELIPEGMRDGIRFEVERDATALTLLARLRKTGACPPQDMH
ncbi:hypothetical protein [Caldimonas brevitalea]|uniref:Methyltransferase domain-containing protein n=1 Tax=Caldimonas brevitalea TaxID=413882 RepID=A0A0G3BKW1_9BURK|nr:hypothetical protein [Caldimonas brevitalea]AKJ30037.1 hypothetical protein AAW51_3346 [Caldimonas brevitalea]